MADPTPQGEEPGNDGVPADQALGLTRVPEQIAGFVRPVEAFILADIERSRDYRKEYYKYAIGIATSLLAFTLAFQPTLKTAPENVWMEFAGWVGLGVAAAAGLSVHLVWSEFFITYRDHDNKANKAAGKAARGKLNGIRTFLDFVLALGLLIGVAGVIAFTASNLHNVAVKTGS